MDAVLKFLQAMTGNRSFEVARTLVKKGERVTMVDVMGRLLERGRMEGRAEGRMEGREQLLFSLVGDGLLSPGAAAERANMSEEEFRKRMREQETQGGRNGR